jgi:Tol biopolymer transport system component
MRTVKALAISVAVAALVVAVGVTGCGGKKHKVTQPDAPAKAALTVTGAGSALTRVTSGDESEWRAVLSQDGHMLLFEVDTVTRAPNGAESVRSSIVGVNPNSSQARTLLTPPNANASFPSWMPDSHGFVYSGDSMGPPAILKTLSDTPGSAVTMVVGNTMAANPSQPAVSPSGKWVAFSTQLRDVWNIAVVGIDGSRLTLLGEGSMPAWSPDEKKISFSRVVSGNKQLFLLNPLTGGELVQITNEGGNFGPCFSPDGRWIAFSSNRAGGGGNIFAVRPDGTGLTKLTETNGSAHRPHWGRDGWIYFDWTERADGNGNSDIWRFQPVGDLAGAGGGGAGGSGLPPASPPGTPSSPPGTPSSPPGTPSFPPGSAPPPTPPPAAVTPPPATPPPAAPPAGKKPKKPKN